MNNISWDTICNPKDQGGLGIRNIHVLNQAYFIKLGWALINDLNVLWVHILYSKYKCGVASILTIAKGHHSSYIWNVVVNNWDHVLSNLAWSINNGHITRFLMDDKISGLGPFNMLLEDNIPILKKHYPVLAYVKNDSWRRDILNYLLPSSARAHLSSIPPPRERMDDIPIWKAFKDGAFFIKEAYNYLTATPPPMGSRSTFSSIQSWHGPQRVKAFLQIVAHGRLLTNHTRKQRHMSDLGTCPCHNMYVESILHSLSGCDDIYVFWFEVIDHNRWVKFFSLGLTN